SAATPMTRADAIPAFATASASLSVPGDCDDGPRICSTDPSSCPPSTILAVQSGCWTCADEHTCASLGLPHSCDDGSRLTCPTACCETPGSGACVAACGNLMCEDGESQASCPSDCSQ